MEYWLRMPNETMQTEMRVGRVGDRAIDALHFGLGPVHRRQMFRSKRLANQNLVVGAAPGMIFGLAWRNDQTTVGAGHDVVAGPVALLHRI